MNEEQLMDWAKDPVVTYQEGTASAVLLLFNQRDDYRAAMEIAQAHLRERDGQEAAWRKLLVECDSEFSAYAYGRPLDKGAAFELSLKCRYAYERTAATRHDAEQRELVENTLALERLDLEAFFDAPEDQADFARWRAAIARWWELR